MAKAWKKLGWKIRAQRWKPPANNTIMLTNDVNEMWQELGRSHYFEGLVEEIQVDLRKVIDSQGDKIE